MFEMKYYVKKEVDQLMSLTEDMERGTLVTYEDIENLIGFNREDSPQWPKVIRLWRKRMMQERGIYPKSERGIGYRLPEVDDQIDHSITMARNSRKRLGVAGVLSAMIRDEDLDEYQTRRVIAVQEVVDETQSRFNIEAAKRKKWFSAQPRLPRPGDSS